MQEKSNDRHKSFINQHIFSPRLGNEYEYCDDLGWVETGVGDPTGEVCVAAGIVVTREAGRLTVPSKGVLSEAGASSALVCASRLQTGQNGLRVISHWSTQLIWNSAKHKTQMTKNSTCKTACHNKDTLP